MDDSIFARLGYDPVRISTLIHGHPPAPGGIVRLGGAAAPPADPPAPEDGGQPSDAVDPTEEDVEVAPAADGAGSPPEEAGSPSDTADDDSLPPPAPSAADAPPSRGGEEEERTAEDDAESSPLLRAWLDEHREVIEAMAKAGEAPVRPASTPPSEEAEPAERPRPYVAREDRWTKWKMAEFLRQLAATHSVTAAAKAVAMSRRSAYKLRARLKGQPFDIAWEAAFRHGYDELAHAALELALEGEEVPHYYQGELKATHRKRSPQLMIQLLKMRNREGAPMLGRYNAAAEYWTENWDPILDRVETGPVAWDDDRRALTPGERDELPDARAEVDRIIRRNLPDEPKGGAGD